MRVIAIDMDDGVAMLVGFLESRGSSIQEEAAGAIAVIATSDSYRGKLVQAGVIAPLVQLPENAAAGATIPARESATHALGELTANSDNV
jgi:hypothetical protein